MTVMNIEEVSFKSIENIRLAIMHLLHECGEFGQVSISLDDLKSVSVTYKISMINLISFFLVSHGDIYDYDGFVFTPKD